MKYKQRVYILFMVIIITAGASLFGTGVHEWVHYLTFKSYEPSYACVALQFPPVTMMGSPYAFVAFNATMDPHETSFLMNHNEVFALGAGILVMLIIGLFAVNHLEVVP